MDGFRIRRYCDEDDKAVKEIFTLGMSEHGPALFMHMLKQPLIQMVLVCVFCFLLAGSKSLLLSVLALTLMMAGLRQMASYSVRNYTQMSLKQDLASIRETYMENTDSCFWVVENKGQLVATVGCLPWQSQPELLELKRMSVRRSHRGLGIGKALCRTVADFTRERGHPAVFLRTTHIQTDAQKLYEHMGFTKMREIPYPTIVGKLANLYLLEYRLELQKGKGPVAMDGFRIRRYCDEDDEAVKEIFTLGMSEHVPAMFMHMLKQPLIKMVLVCVCCFLLASSKSLLLSVLALTLMMAGLRQLASSYFRNYTEMSLKQDLASIRETYMEKTDSCFWVVENKGQLVATVGCLPSQSQPELLELKRMSVRRSHRGLGIGKALCWTVADFTRERGHPAVFLRTTQIQIDAQKLYEHMGFTKMREIPIPTIVGKLANLYLLEYRLELQEGKIG